MQKVEKMKESECIGEGLDKALRKLYQKQILSCKTPQGLYLDKTPMQTIPEEQEEKKEEDEENHMPTELISPTPTRGANANAATNNRDGKSLGEDPQKPSMIAKIKEWMIQGVDEVKSGDDQSIGNADSMGAYIIKQMMELAPLLSNASVGEGDDQSVSSTSSVGRLIKDKVKKLVNSLSSVSDNERNNLIKRYQIFQEKAESDGSPDVSREIAKILLEIGANPTLKREFYQATSQRREQGNNPTNNEDGLRNTTLNPQDLSDVSKNLEAEGAGNEEEKPDLSQTPATSGSDSDEQNSALNVTAPTTTPTLPMAGKENETRDTTRGKKRVHRGRNIFKMVGSRLKGMRTKNK